MNRAAVIVIGSNSTRLVSADLTMNLKNTLRRRMETRLFLHMENGLLSADAIRDTSQGIQEMSAASDAPVQGIYATSAVRDAKNADALARAIQELTGHPLTILKGEEEAAASFYGAAGDESAGIIDIGGGSTEIALGQGGRISNALSLQLGASRLFRMSPIHTIKDVLPAIHAASEALNDLPDAVIHHSSRTFYSVGGTGTAVALLIRQLPHAPGAAEGCILTRKALYQQLLRVAAVPREQRAEIPFFPASRAEILPTGMAILVAIMDRLSLASVHVTERCNADGLLRMLVQKKIA